MTSLEIKFLDIFFQHHNGEGGFYFIDVDRDIEMGSNMRTFAGTESEGPVRKGLYCYSDSMDEELLKHYIPTEIFEIHPDFQGWIGTDGNPAKMWYFDLDNIKRNPDYYRFHNDRVTLLPQDAYCREPEKMIGGCPTFPCYRKEGCPLG